MVTQARSIASLTISFGLVAIPVKLYSATVSTERISFNLLRQKDGSRVKQQYVAVNDGKAVERSEMVKGYEFAKDQYVMFSPEELKALEDATSHSIDIGQFVPLESVDPVYFDGTYYLAPDKGGGKPYTLLATALRKAQQCAVGRWISRGKEHIVVIRPIESGLALHQLHFKAEVRDLKDLGIEPATVSEPELKLAQQLIDQLHARRLTTKRPVTRAQEARMLVNIHEIRAYLMRELDRKLERYGDPDSWPSLILIVNQNWIIEITHFHDQAILLQENGDGPHKGRRWFTWNTTEPEMASLVLVIKHWLTN